MFNYFNLKKLCIVLIPFIEFINNVESIDYKITSPISKIIVTENGLDLHGNHLKPIYKNKILTFGYKLFKVLEENNALRRFNRTFDYFRTILEKNGYLLSIFLNDCHTDKIEMEYKKMILTFAYKLFLNFKKMKHLNEFNEIFNSLISDIEKNYYLKHNFFCENRFKGRLYRFIENCKCSIFDTYIYNIFDKVFDEINTAQKNYNNITTLSLPIIDGTIDVFYGVRVPEEDISQNKRNNVNYIKEYKLKQVLIQYIGRWILINNEDEKGIPLNKYLLNGIPCKYTPRGIANSIIRLLKEANGLFGIDQYCVETFNQGNKSSIEFLLETFCNRLTLANVSESYPKSLYILIDPLLLNREATEALQQNFLSASLRKRIKDFVNNYGRYILDF